MSAAIGRGAQNMHIHCIKPALRKGYHKKSGGVDTPRLNHEEAKNNNFYGGSPADADVVWIPDSRTGIYYPKGQEKVMENVPSHAAKDYTVNWFSMP
ncbi:uncharacterized protein LOC112510514 [Cynara cardunculus var. scolymus]|uniref:uncharacterized protein LOC112510514 n=1 Tax=Cynara cardunculus var. scolymus TaxID=59895 RepID=UPI000D626DE2|nr:uncharacterized protein LOC112510514 [Cynara cardunculus var. scolymus]